MKIYDISQPLSDGALHWPGDPEFQHRWVWRIRHGAQTNVSAVALGVHTGTHVDAPLHLDDNGCDVTGIPLERFVGPARVISLDADKSIGLPDLIAEDWTGVKRVLFKTRNSLLMGSPFNEDFVCMEEKAAVFLAEKGLWLVGIDAPSVDHFHSESLPCHRVLLGRGVVILENARLQHVPPGDYELTCLPLKLTGLEGSPVRAILRDLKP